MRAALFLTLALCGLASSGGDAPAGEGVGRRSAKSDKPGLRDKVKSLLLRWFRRPDGRWENQWAEHLLSEGDIVFFQTKDTTWQTVFAAFGSPGVTHIGLVVRQDDGELGLLHALDPHFKIKPSLRLRRGVTVGQVCWTPDVVDYLSEYDGRVFIRPYRSVFPANASRRLTEWAKRQVGKPYGVHKLGLPPIGLPVQSWFHLAGPAQVEDDSWFCSELIASALVVTRHLSPWHVRPVRTDPEDLFSDHWINLQPAWEPPLLWSASIPEAPEAQRLHDVAKPQFVELTIKNPTRHTYRLVLNRQFVTDLPPRHEIPVRGVAGQVNLRAEPLRSMTGQQTLSLSGDVTEDTTWSLSQ